MMVGIFRSLLLKFMVVFAIMMPWVLGCATIICIFITRTDVDMYIVLISSLITIFSIILYVIYIEWVYHD